MCLGLRISGLGPRVWRDLSSIAGVSNLLETYNKDKMYVNVGVCRAFLEF